MNVTATVDAQSDCRRVSEVLSRVGDKWTMQVVVSLRDQSRRFNDVKREVGSISQQMLTRTLRSLERDGLVKRTVSPTSSPQVAYALTELGASLAEPVRQLANWARVNLSVIHGCRAQYDETAEAALQPGAVAG